MTESFTLDTNILIYAVDQTAGDKHIRSRQLLDLLATKHGPLPLQCLNEFYRACVQKHILPAEDAKTFVELTSLSLEISPASFQDTVDAMRVQQAHNLSFWDALLCATAIRIGCKTIFTEDLQDSRTLGGLTFRNPFKLSTREFSSLIASS